MNRCAKAIMAALFAAAVSALVFSAAHRAEAAKARRPAAPKVKTAKDILRLMQRDFLDKDIRTLSYVQIRIVSTRAKEKGKYSGKIPFTKQNVTRQRIKYYYKAPGRHKYVFLSEKINVKDVGEPNTGTIEMDEEWERRLLDSYNVTLTAEETWRGRKCWVVSFSPKSEESPAVPMSWFVDKEKRVVLKLISLTSSPITGKLSTFAEFFYKKIDGRLLMSSARWVQTPSELPYTFNYKVFFGEYQINKKMDNAVFSK